MYKPESILENETHKILRGFEIQMDHSILARRPDLVLINKKEKNLLSSGFFHSSRQYSKDKRKQKGRQILESYQQTGKAVEHEDNSDTSCSWSSIPIVIGALGTISKGLVRELENRKLNDHSRPSKLQHC